MHLPDRLDRLTKSNFLSLSTLECILAKLVDLVSSLNLAYSLRYTSTYAKLRSFLTLLGQANYCYNTLCLLRACSCCNLCYLIFEVARLELSTLLVANCLSCFEASTFELDVISMLLVGRVVKLLIAEFASFPLG